MSQKHSLLQSAQSVPSALTADKERIVSYFKDYISIERDQNRKWLSATNGSELTAAEKEHHREEVAKKEEALGNYERILTEAYHQISIDYGKTDVSWPNLFDRFKSIGKEINYRTVYAALCSQAHNDAEDLLNRFIAGVVQIEGMSERQKRENISFALFMTLMSVATLIESTAMYLAKYSLGPKRNAHAIVG